MALLFAECSPSILITSWVGEAARDVATLYPAVWILPSSIWEPPVYTCVLEGGLALLSEYLAPWL